jgi:Fe-Mn family superoxide dismutase
MYTAENFERLLGLAGMSDALLKNHFTLYEGYVKNTNALIEILHSGKYAAGTPEYNELTRRLGWEWNGMRLHELYFGNMTKDTVALRDGSAIGTLLTTAWGSVEDWKKEFIGIGSVRGIGWVVLSFDPKKRAVFNTWVNEHDGGHFAGSVPLLVMDVFEHAFMLDYGLKRAEYIGAFMRAIDWAVVEGRLQKASGIA